jgi:hypothetical protein
MNGRIYDPLLGRFLSADLVVQYPNNLQSYNRYSYVRNNPLTTFDSTGFWENTYATMTDAATAQYSQGNTVRAGLIVVGQQLFQMASLGTFSRNSAVAGQVGVGQLSVAKGSTQMAANTAIAATAATAAVVTGGASAAVVGGSGLAAGVVGGAVGGFSAAAVQTGGDTAIAAATGGRVPTMGENAAQIADATVKGAVGGALVGGAAAIENRVASAAPQTGPAPEVNPTKSVAADAQGTGTPATTVEVKTRPTAGRDGGTSELHVERDAAGDVVSKKHVVTTDGEVVHQHQEHVGASGSVRSFPDEWTGTETVNARPAVPQGPRVPEEGPDKVRKGQYP